MAKDNNLTDFLTGVATAIRTKKGYSEDKKINPQAFEEEIGTISTGIDISDTTATSADVRRGKDFYSSDGTKTQGTIENYGGASLSMSATTLSTAQYGMSAAAIGDKIYLHGQNTNFELFDTETNTHSLLEAVTSYGTFYAPIAAINKKIYLCSGNGLRAIAVLNPETDTVEVKNLSYSLESNCSGAAVDNKIYLFGGSTFKSGTTINVYDIVNNTLSKSSIALPVSASGIAACAVNDKIYLFGGHNTDTSASIYGTYLDSINVFDVTNNTISTLDVKLPVGMANIGVAALDNRIYLFGGYSYNGEKFNTVYEFDTLTNTIKKLDVELLEKMLGIAAATVNDKIYLFGGQSNGIKDFIQIFSPKTSVLITSKDGEILETNGKYCVSNITVVPQLQEKTITPSETQQTVTSDANYAGLYKVTVEAIPDVVNSVDLNIAYGDIAPVDTNKLWVKSENPDIVTISSDFAYKNCEETTSVATDNVFSSALDVCDGGYCLYVLTSNAIYRMSKTTFECSMVRSVSNATSLCLVDDKIFYLSTYHTSYSSPNPYGDNWQRDQAKLFSYDLSNNTVEEITKVGVVSHHKGKVVAYNGDVYMVGGGDYYHYYDALHSTNTTQYNQAKFVTVYSPNKNMTKTFEVDLGNTWNSNRVLIDGKIYVFGGALNDAEDATQNDGIYAIDLSSSTSQKLNAVLPVATSKIGVSALGENIYISGGFKTEKDIYKYSIPTETITKIDITLTRNRAECTTFFVGPNLYLAGTNTNMDKVRIFSYLKNSNLKLLCTYKGDRFKFSENSTESVSSILGVYKGDENNIAQLVESYVYDGTNWIGLDGTIIFTKLYSPGVYISSGVLHIVDDFRNNSKTTEFYVYKGESNIDCDHTSENTINLSGKTYINVGSNELRVEARADGYTKSEKNIVNYYYTIFSVNKELTHMNSTESSLVTIPINGSASVTLTAEEGYSLPSYIRVDGADYTWNASTGVVAISNPKRYVLLTASGTPKTWSITSNLNGITAKEGNPTTINTGAEATLGFSVKAGYGNPEKSAVENSVAGATGVWDDSSKTLKLSNPVSDVSFTINAVPKTYNINPKLVDVIADVTNPTTIASGETATLKFTANEGYILPKEVYVYGVESRAWDSDKGELTISSPYDSTGTISFTIDCSYNIVEHLHDVTSVSGNPSRIKIGGEVELKYQAASGYVLPDSVTVTNATLVSWDKDTGSLKISNPTSTVSIEVNGVKDSGIKVTVNIEGNNDPITLADGQSYTSPVNTYELRSAQTVVGIESGYAYVAGDDPGGRVYTGYFYSKPTVSGDVSIENWDASANNGGGSALFKVNGPGVINIVFWCLIEGTQITLADGSTKAIEDITYDDELLVWNFYEGKFDKAKPTWIKVAETTLRYNLVKFSNGAEVGFVGAGGEKGYHRIFNKEAGAFTHTGVKDAPNGTTTFAQDRTFPTVVSQEVVEKEVKFYNVITDKHYNIFANGILTSCRLSNEYKIEDMKYVGERLITEEQIRAYFERIKNKRK